MQYFFLNFSIPNIGWTDRPKLGVWLITQGAAYTWSNTLPLFYFYLMCSDHCNPAESGHPSMSSYVDSITSVYENQLFIKRLLPINNGR
jgi:hypothetical protein